MSEPSSSAGRGRYRWVIGGLLGSGAFVNYMDRVNISVAATPLSHSLHLSVGELGVVLSAYLWTYAVLQIPVGSLIDRIGIPWVMRISTILWTVASFLTAFAGGLGLLLVSRLILGVGEAPTFPASWKATGYWFPKRERGMATSLLDGASKMSNVIGLPLMAFLVTTAGWQAAFIFTGALSLLFTVAFWLIYRNPDEAIRAGRLSKSEYAFILDGGAQPITAAPSSPWADVGYLLRRRKTWGLALGFASYTYVFYLLLSFLPSYLEKSLGLSVLGGGVYAVIPWAVAVVAEFVIAGWLLDRLIKRGADPTKVRRWFLAVSLIAALGVVGTVSTHNIVVVLACLSIGTAGLAVNAPTSTSIVALIAPQGSVAALGGVVNCVANLIGLAAPIVTGFAVQATGSYTVAFVIAGVVMVLGLISYVVVLGPIEQIPSPARNRPVADLLTVPGPR